MIDPQVPLAAFFRSLTRDRARNRRRQVYQRLGLATHGSRQHLDRSRVLQIERQVCAGWAFYRGYGPADGDYREAILHKLCHSIAPQKSPRTGDDNQIRVHALAIPVRRR